MRASPLHLALVFLAFTVSGTSGLLYQVVWVREFGDVFGNTVHSAALVTAVFMTGLGLGGWLAGLVADRRTPSDPLAGLRLYALAELGIAALGLAVLWILPRLEPLSAALSAYRVDDRGWHELTYASYAFRYAAALVLLTPITLLMGGTLTLLIRFLVRAELALAGWRIGLLYGLNTAGAALGCLAVDFWAIPRLGLSGTQLLAVAGNVVAAAGALAIWAQLRGADRDAPAAPAVAAATPATDGLRLVLVAIFLSGAAGMGMEIVWFRFLTGTLGPFRMVFSLLLFVILVGIWLGSVTGGALSRAVGRPARLYMGSQLAFALTALASFATFDVAPLYAGFAETYPRLGAGWRPWYELGAYLWQIAKLAGAPAFFMGFAYPLANAIVQTREASVGGRAGLLYLANTLGAVTGSVLAGFALIPGVGVQGSVLALVTCGALALVPIHLGADERPRPLAASPRFAAGVGVAAVVLAVSLAAVAARPAERWILQNFERRHGFAELLREPFVLATSEGLVESIMVTDFPGRSRTLYTNGYSMSGTRRGAQRYMSAFAHLPLLQLDTPRRVLVICFGVGTTLHAASLHPSVESLEVADLSRHVLEHAQWFEATNGAVLRDPRVSVFVNDGRQHLRMQPEGRYDLVTLEPPPISGAGVGALYSREFYALARSRLAPGGFATQWLPIDQLPGDVVRSLVRAFVDVFPNAVLLNGALENFILMGRRDGETTLDPTRVAQRIRARPAVAADLRANLMGTMTELVGSFTADAGALDRGTRGYRPVSDAFPLMEYVNIMFEPRVPVDLFDVGAVRTWCPACFDGDRPVPAVRDLDAYLGVMDAFYHRPEFVRALRGPAAGERPVEAEVDPAAMERVVTASPYLRALIDVGDPTGG